MSSFPSSKNDAGVLFLRLEGPLQSWGERAIGRSRGTASVPTKSGLMGLLGAALGLSRAALNRRLDELNSLAMAVRVDRAGHVAEDYQTVGARIGVVAADGQVKKTPSTGEYEAIISPRDYLVDASFLVLLRGNPAIIEELADALRNPRWPLYLGRKRCVPGARVFAGSETGLSLADAIRRDGPDDDSLREPDNSPSVRVVTDLIDQAAFGLLLRCEGNELASRYAAAKSYLHDRLVQLAPPVHGARIVLDFTMRRPSPSVQRPELADPLFGVPPPVRPQRANDPDARKAARAKSGGRCIFCRHEPENPKRLHAHHLTYVRRGRERVTDDSQTTGTDDLVMLCDECHAAVSMLEYQNGFGLERIDPRNPRWHASILAAREARRRHSDPARPVVAPGPQQWTDGDGTPLALIETTIPLNAGSSFAPDAPGNVWLANRHHVHQRLSMAFPKPGGQFAAQGYGVRRDEGGFLFRIEPGPLARILVRSRILPDWGRAFAGAAWLVPRELPAAQRLDLGQFVLGDHLTFDLEANPVKRLRADGPEGRQGARVPLRDDHALRQWIDRRACEAGFETVEGSLIVERLGRRTAKMTSVPDRHWDGVRFSGQLRVTDPDGVRRALVCGIGPAKAFGFGMLAVGRVQP